MIRNQLINSFKNKELTKFSGTYKSVLRKRNYIEGKLYPYIPFIGKKYDKHKILIYATAQSNPSRYSNIDQSIERLYYSDDFSQKYPESHLSYSGIQIRPYQNGVIPSLAGLLIYKISGIKIKDLDKIQDHISVSNYYKFSLKHPNNNDLNPHTLSSPQPQYYYEVNDDLVTEEIVKLEPDYIIIAFTENKSARGNLSALLNEKARQRGLKKKIQVIHVNDPANILRNRQYYNCKINNIEINELIDKYYKQIRGRYKNVSEVKSYWCMYYKKFK